MKFFVVLQDGLLRMGASFLAEWQECNIAIDKKQSNSYSMEIFKFVNICKRSYLDSVAQRLLSFPRLER